jgi:hypothetical protein
LIADPVVRERARTAVAVARHWDEMGLTLDEAVAWCEHTDAMIIATGCPAQIRKWLPLHDLLMALLAASLGLSSLIPSPTIAGGCDE